MPGADGAPLETDDDDGGVCRFVVDVAWPDAGTIRRAWSGRLELLVLECRRCICVLCFTIFAVASWESCC